MNSILIWKKWLAWAGLTALLVGCGGGGERSTGVTGGTPVIRLGAAVAMTGPLAKEGQLVKDGYEFWKNYVNQQGGIAVGGRKYRVEILYYDDKSEAQTAAKLVEKLVTEDKVKFILGPMSSGITDATSSIGEKYRVLTIAPVANADKLYSRGYKYLFGVLPLASKYLHALEDMATTFNPRPTRVAIISPDDLFPLAAAEGAKAKAEELGLEVVYFGKYPKTARDLSPVLTEVKAKVPDIVLSTGYVSDAVTVVKQLKDLKFTPKILGFTNATAIPDFRAALGKDVEYVYGSEWWTPNMTWKDPLFESAGKFAGLFKEQFKYDPTYHNASAAAAGHLLAMAMQQAGTTTDVEKVRAALTGLDTEIFFGKVKFNEQGVNVAGASGVVQIQGGQLVVTYPKAIQQKAPVYPMPPWDKR